MPHPDERESDKKEPLCKLPPLSQCGFLLHFVVSPIDRGHVEADMLGKELDLFFHLVAELSVGNENEAHGALAWRQVWLRYNVHQHGDHIGHGLPAASDVT